MQAIWSDTAIAESGDTVASCDDVVVGDDVNAGAAWYYPEPEQAAAEIRGRVAFSRGAAVKA